LRIIEAVLACIGGLTVLLGTGIVAVAVIDIRRYDARQRSSHSWWAELDSAGTCGKGKPDA
jgi:hypothetical protein